MRAHVLLGLLALVLMLSPSSATAQAPASGDAPVAAPEPAAAAKEPGLWDRLIYLPYKSLSTVFDRQQATVVIPYTEYLRLTERDAALERLTPEKPPVNAVITSAHYRARIEKDVARVTAEFKINVLDKPWAEVPLNFGAAAVGKVESKAGEALLRGTGRGTYSLLLPSKGEHAVTIELVTRVHTSPDGQNFELGVPTVGITTFELVLAENDQTVELTPNLVALPVEKTPANTGGAQAIGEVVAAGTHVRASLGATEKIVARWFPRAGLKPDMDLLASVATDVRINIADGLLHTDAFLTYQVLRGEMQQVRIAAPLNQRILDVSTSNAKIRGWKAVNEEKRQVITVDLIGGTANKVDLEVHTEGMQPEGAFQTIGIAEDGTVNGIHPLDVVRENGFLTVSQGSDLTLSVEDRQGMVRIDESEAPASARKPGALYYKYYSPKVRLAVAARPVSAQISVIQHAEAVFTDDELRITSTLQYQIDRAGVFELRIQLPEDMVVDNVTCDCFKEHIVDKATGLLLVQLTEQKLGPLSLVIKAHVPLESGEAATELEIPVPEPLGVSRETGTVAIYAPDSLDVVTAEAALAGVHPEATANYRSLANVRTASAWSYSRRPVTIPVEIKRKPTRLSARVGTLIDVKEQGTEVVTLLEFTVRHAGLDTFRFAVPEAVSPLLQIEPSALIKQHTHAAEAVDGWVTWTIVTQQEVTGTHQFKLTYDLRRDVLDAEHPANAEKRPGLAEGMELTIRPVRVLDIEARGDNKPAVQISSRTGEISVSKDRSLAVTADPSGGDIEAIDVREFLMLPQQGSLAFRYHKDPVSVKLVASKHEIQEVLSTVVSRALVEIVTDRDDTASYRCRYVIRSSERQRLPILLPQGIGTFGVFINGRPVSLEKAGADAATKDAGRERYFVNLAGTGKPDESIQLLIQFRAPVSRPYEQAGGKLPLSLPQIGESDGVAVQSLRIIAWAPDKYSLVGTPDEFVKERPFNGDEWLGWSTSSSSGVLDFPTDGNAYYYSRLGATDHISFTWWDDRYYAWILSAAAFVIAFVLVRTSWENKLTVLLFAAFLATLYAVIDADPILHGLQAARYGLIAMALLWIIHAFAQLGVRRKPQTFAGPYPMAVVAAVPPPGVFDDDEAKS